MVLYISKKKFRFCSAKYLEIVVKQSQNQNQNCYWWHVQMTIFHQELANDNIFTKPYPELEKKKKKKKKLSVNEILEKILFQYRSNS